MALNKLTGKSRPHNVDVVDYWLAQATDVNGCLVVSACKDKDNYPLVWIGGKNGKLRHLSRLVLARKLGRALQHYALHTCDNVECVNPEHLYEGTQLQNRADAVARGRTAKGERSRGQPRKFTPQQIGEIRALRGVEPQHVTGTRFGVHQVQVSQIQLRKIYKWVQA